MGILLAIGLLVTLVPPALATTDTEQTGTSPVLLNMGQGKAKGKSWHQGEEVVVLKGEVKEATVEEDNGIITITLEDGELEDAKVIKVSEDAIKGPLKSRIWSGIEDPEVLEGTVVVALVRYDEESGAYIAKHISIAPGRTYGHFHGEVIDFTAYSNGTNPTNGSITIEPARPVGDGDGLAFSITQRTKFPNDEPTVGDWATVIAHKPYSPDIPALAVVRQPEPPLLAGMTRLEGTIDSISDSTITLDIDGALQPIIYDDETVVVIRGGISLEEGDEVIVLAVKGDDDQLLARGIFAGLEPAQVIQWLGRQRMQWQERHGLENQIAPLNKGNLLPRAW